MNIRLYINIALTLVLMACAIQPRSYETPTSPPKPRAIVNPKIALVLGGGGARGMAHLGVISVLQENNIPIDLVVGTSVGSIVGAVYADQPHNKNLYELFINTKKSDLVNFSFFSGQGGWDSGGRLESFLFKNLSVQDFSQLKIPFIAVSTDLSTGKVFPLRSGPIIPAVHASSAISGLFVPVHIYNTQLIDGGFSQPLPVLVAKKFHPKLIIAVNIEKKLARDYQKDFVSIISRSIDIVISELSRKAILNTDVLISPNIEEIGTFDDSNNLKLYKLGREAALAKIFEIKQKMRIKSIRSKV